MDLKARDKQEWFETWFDTPYYHLLYDHRDEKEAEEFLNTLLSYLKLPPQSNVLDAGCGTGRYSVFLANKNYNVVGIDLSWKNIQHAANFESDTLTFLTHDMREPFHVNYFEAAFNFFTSFGYFNSERDNLKAIRSLSNSLKKGGRLVIDFFNAEKVIRELPSSQQVLKGGILFLIKKHLRPDVAEPGNSAIVKKIYFQDRGKEFHFEERVQALRLHDFKKYFQLNHLELRNVFGDYQLNSFDPQTSDRMILVAEKK